MSKAQKWVNIILWLLIIILGSYILFRGAALIKETSVETKKTYILDKMLTALDDLAVETYMPGLSYSLNEPDVSDSITSFLTEKVFESIPIYSYIKNSLDYQPEIENSSITDMIIYAEGVAEEKLEAMSLAEESEAETQPEATGGSVEQESSIQDETQSTEGAWAVEASGITLTPVAEINFDKLNDFDYLKNSFYKVDSSTTIDSTTLNAQSLMADDLSIEVDSSVPQILIYHTHSQEAFIDSIPGDSSMTIVGVGDYLTELLEQYGFNVIHDTTAYDIIDGQIDRDAAYTVAGEKLPQILEANPTIEVMIDLHRDGVEKHLVTEINGKQTAQIMFFNGLSYSARNGPIDYLPNAYVQDNLAFSFQMQLKAAQYFPGYTRGIYLRSLRFNMHFRARTLFVESGSQLNTLQEQLNAMEPLAAMLNELLRGE